MYEGTIDWDAYWRTSYESETDCPANVGRYGKADLLARFFEQVGMPDDFAAVGCGPADCPVKLAERYPEMDVYAFDAAESVVRRNRERVNRENVSFGVAALPEFEVESGSDTPTNTGADTPSDTNADTSSDTDADTSSDADPDRQFDVVYCYATLHYVRDVERAIRNLYDRVRSGGYLVANYPNEETRETYDEDFAEHDEFSFGDRFGLVLEGANLTTTDEIADWLDAEVRDYWAAVGTDADWANPANPCVYVEK